MTDINNANVKSTGTMIKLRKTWNRKEITLESGIYKQIQNLCVQRSVLRLKNLDTQNKQRKGSTVLTAFEMKCYKRLLQIHWSQKIKNIEVEWRLGVDVDILKRMMERKLNLCVHKQSS